MESSAAEYCNAARKLWLNAKTESDLEVVEEMYLRAIETWSNRNRYNCKENATKRKKEMETFSTREEYALAEEKLALLLCQTGRAKQVKKSLRSLGYVCRLSNSVLDYTEEDSVESVEPEVITGDAPCIILDNFLSLDAINFLKRIFEDPQASYWSDHNYQVEPPSPYFSYALPIADPSLSECGYLGHLIQQIYHCSILRSKFPDLGKAKYVEMWAHNRPHASGHQMHFDSDDEGRGGVRNPVMSTILYLTAGSGGPSLITTQEFGEDCLAEKGWLCHPREKRLVAFDGRVLHGVVPGKKFSCGGRRVTLMFAFWKDLRIRQEKGLGSSRPLPFDKPWAQQLRQAVENCHCKNADGDDSNSSYLLSETSPIPVDCVYETLEGKPWSKKMGLPSYDQVFQGF